MSLKNYSHERERLQSFRHWPSSCPIKPTDLVTEGFYYTGVRDQVECFACKKRFDLWQQDDDPQKKHKEASPWCPLVQSKSKHKIELPNNAPLHDMSIEANRLATFGNLWSRDSPLRPEELAKAGFYFIGKGDKVECHVCHIILKCWKSGDTAEGEHRLHSPFCPILKGNSDASLKEQPTPQHSVAQPSSPRRPPILKQPYLEHEHMRLETFKRWPRTVPVSLHDLAAAGFYYTGRGDTVRCFSCQVQLQQWTPGDVPAEEHVKHSPDCQFARSVLRKKERSGAGVLPTRSSEKSMNYQERLATFCNWPASSPVSAESLAEAGFCYTGKRDLVRCMTCGGALRGWERGDEAWGEHLRHFPTCRLVMEHFGQNRSPSYDEPWHQPKERQPQQKTSPEFLSFTNKAVEMGFNEVLAEKVYQKGFESFSGFLEALMQASEASEAPPVSRRHSPVPSAPPAESMNVNEIKESRLCKICMESESDILFLPCAHIVCCQKCVETLCECPICRSPIQSKIKSYFA